jgi:hypothetical protein
MNIEGAPARAGRTGRSEGTRKRLIAAGAAATVLVTAFISTGSILAAPQGNDKGAGDPGTLPCPDIPGFDRANFAGGVENPLFPLEPGTVYHLRGETEDGIEREKIRVTNRTKEILGVTTTVIKDVVRVNGKIAESTHDWYAADNDGNVWYFGENTAEYKNGEIINRHGSWKAGEDGAHAGIIMQANPEVTDSCRQEYYKGEAEDMYWVVNVGETKEVPYGKFKNVVRTLEWQRLEPKVMVEKFHAPGVGLIAERALSGGKEIVELTDVKAP